MRSIGSRVGTVSGKVPIGTGAMELGLITCRFLSSVDGTQEGEMIQLQSTQIVSKNCLIPNWSLRTQNFWKVKVKKGKAGKAGGGPLAPAAWGGAFYNGSASFFSNFPPATQGRLALSQVQYE